MNSLSLIFVLLLLPAVPASSQQRPVDRILPALATGKGCVSVVELQNLASHTVWIAVEGYGENGALVAMKGRPQITVQLAPQERGTYRLELPEENTGAWVRVRETPLAGEAPVVAVRGSTECVDGNQLRTVAREISYPMRNPWYEADISALSGDIVAMVNTSSQPAVASVCYWTSSYYSVPNGRQGGELTPVCSAKVSVQVPPFSAHQFPVSIDGSTRFSLKTTGPAVVLQMLKPDDVHKKFYTVDSSIKFGAEVDHP